MSWTWSGVDYQLDVSAANLEKIEHGRVPLAKLLEVSTRVGGRRQSTAPKIGTPKVTAGSAPAGSSAREIREWATQAGYEVPARGRLPQSVLDAYAAAN